MPDWTDYLKTLVAVAVIVNPIGVIPVFVSLTTHQSPAEKKKTAATSALAVCAVLVSSSVLGNSLLSLFGISIDSFRVGGGILLLLLAVSMFHAQQSPSKQIPEEASEAEIKGDVAVTPLAIPLLAGPGAISTIIIYTQQFSGITHKGLIILICMAISLLVWITLRAAVPVGNALGRTGINIVTRLMGLILAAVAVEFMVGGLSKLFPGLVSGLGR